MDFHVADSVKNAPKDKFPIVVLYTEDKQTVIRKNKRDFSIANKSSIEDVSLNSN